MKNIIRLLGKIPNKQLIAILTIIGFLTTYIIGKFLWINYYSNYYLLGQPKHIAFLEDNTAYNHNSSDKKVNPKNTKNNATSEPKNEFNEHNIISIVKTFYNTSENTLTVYFKNNSDVDLKNVYIKLKTNDGVVLTLPKEDYLSAHDTKNSTILTSKDYSKSISLKEYSYYKDNYEIQVSLDYLISTKIPIN